MFLLVFFIFVMIMMLLVFMFIGTPRKCWVDCTSPLNLVMYKEPGSVYSDQLVNLWVDKPWHSDGSRIPCRIETFSSDTDQLIIYSHGNAENILNCVQFLRELSSSLQMNVLSFDYSGYGLNKANRFERTEEGVNLTLKTIYDNMITKYNYKPENIILWGYSLGSGPSVYLASQLCQTGKELKGLVLFGAYSSILDVVEDSTNKKISELFTNRWNSAKIIHHVTCNILLLHGQSDGLIKIKHAQKLKKANPNAKLITMPNIGHTSFSWTDSIKEVKDWLKFVDHDTRNRVRKSNLIS
jgi:pimeloyl-ACP methyl ester carboxylesterase